MEYNTGYIREIATPLNIQIYEHKSISINQQLQGHEK